MDKKVITRLIRYKNALRRLSSLSMSKVISDNIAEMIGVSASQVRADFSMFNLEGSKRGGYQINDLLIQLEGLLHKGGIQEVILIGIGHLGKAFLNYKGFEKENIRIIAGFDIKPVKVVQNSIEVFPMEKLEDFIKTHNVKVAALTVAENAVLNIYDQLVSFGIKGILNFSPLRILDSKDCIVQNVNLSLVFEQLIYMVNNDDK